MIEKNARYQASNVAIQLDIVEVVAGGVHLSWVQLSCVLHVEDCLEVTFSQDLIQETVLPFA